MNYTRLGLGEQESEKCGDISWNKGPHGRDTTRQASLPCLCMIYSIALLELKFTLTLAL